MSHPPSSQSIFGALGKGIIKGALVFLLPVLVYTNWNEIKAVITGVAQLPISHQLTNDFKTGFEVAGALFGEQLTKFYEVRTTNQWTHESWSFRERKATAPIAWNRAELEDKLETKFGAGKRRSARHFLNYIEKYETLAAEEMIRTHIPASIKLAQGILESKAGQSRLATSANNHFGIKCKKRKGYKADGVIDDNDFYHDDLAYDCEQHADDHKWDRFEMYESPEISYYRHSNLLTQMDRYNWLLDEYQTGRNYTVSEKWFGQTLVPYYAAWAIGLKKSGYATSKTYAQKITYIIETYELWRVDYSVVFSVS